MILAISVSDSLCKFVSVAIFGIVYLFGKLVACKKGNLAIATVVIKLYIWFC